MASLQPKANGRSTSADYQFYVFKNLSAFEAEAFGVLYEEFYTLEPARRPWVGVGLKVYGLKTSREIDFLIVSPKSVAAVETKGVRNVEVGTVYGHPNWEEWYLKTAGGGQHPIKSSAGTPLNQAQDGMYRVKENRDQFFGLRGAVDRAPFIKSLLVFPDAYDLSGIEQVKIGAQAQDQITVVNLKDLAPASLNGRNTTEAALLREWVTSLIGYSDHPTFRATWLDPDLAQRRTGPSSFKSEERYFSGKTNDSPQATLNTARDKAKPEQATEQYSSNTTLTGSRGENFNSGYEAAPRIVYAERKSAATTLFAGAALVLLATLVYLLAGRPQQTTIELSPVENNQGAVTPAPPAMPLEHPAEVPPQQPEFHVVPQPYKPKAPQSSNSRPDPEKPWINTADAGTYETIRTAAGHAAANDGSEIVELFPPRTRLTVQGSIGEWLAVSPTRELSLVYVRREHAMKHAPRAAAPAPREADPKRIEMEIQQKLRNWGVTNVTVTVIGETAYLKGTVKTKEEQYRAGLAAQAILDAENVVNWVRWEP